MASDGFRELALLISPDDGSPLREEDGQLVDRSGNRYSRKGAIYDLRPRRPVRGEMRYELRGPEFFRSYPFQQALTPIYSTDRGVSFKERAIAGFLPPPHPQAACLDHGCGGGELQGFLQAAGYTYVGADNESGVTATQGGSDRFSGGVTHLCDLHRLPFAADSFQFSVSYSVFEHLQNPFVAASELHRVMEPGGVCFIAVASLLPFHMDSLYHHTHYGALNTFAAAGFDVLQIAAADWNGYRAISDMDGLPGPRWLRLPVGQLMTGLHRSLWQLRTLVKRRDPRQEELRRRLTMAGMIKLIVVKPT